MATRGLVGSKRSLADAHGSQPEQVDADFLCSICQELLVEPCTGICGHQFCKLCLEAWRTAKQGEPGGAVCPECRGSLFASSNQPLGVCRLLERMLQQQYPQQYQARLHEVQEKRASKEQDIKQQVEFHTAAVRAMLLSSLAGKHNTRAARSAGNCSSRAAVAEPTAQQNSAAAGGVHQHVQQAPLEPQPGASRVHQQHLHCPGPQSTKQQLSSRTPVHSMASGTNKPDHQLGGLQQSLPPNHPSTVTGQIVAGHHHATLGQLSGLSEYSTIMRVQHNNHVPCGLAMHLARNGEQPISSLPSDRSPAPSANLTLPMLPPPARVQHLAVMPPSSPTRSAFSELSSVFHGWASRAPTGGGSVLDGGYALPTGFVQGPAVFGVCSRHRRRVPCPLPPVPPADMVEDAVQLQSFQTQPSQVQIQQAASETRTIEGRDGRAARHGSMHVHAVPAATLEHSHHQAEGMPMLARVAAHSQQPTDAVPLMVHNGTEISGAASPSHSVQSGGSDPAEQALLTDEQNLGPEDLDGTDAGGLSPVASGLLACPTIMQGLGLATAALPDWLPVSSNNAAQPSCLNMQADAHVSMAVASAGHMTIEMLEAQFAAQHPTEPLDAAGTDMLGTVYGMDYWQQCQAAQFAAGLPQTHQQWPQQQAHQGLNMQPWQHVTATVVPASSMLPNSHIPYMLTLQGTTAMPLVSDGMQAAQSSIQAADVILGNDDDQLSGDVLQHACHQAQAMELGPWPAAAMDAVEGYGDSDDTVAAPLGGASNASVTAAASRAMQGSCSAQLLAPASTSRSQEELALGVTWNNSHGHSLHVSQCMQGEQEEYSSTGFSTCMAMQKPTMPCEADPPLAVIRETVVHASDMQSKQQRQQQQQCHLQPPQAQQGHVQQQEQQQGKVVHAQPSAQPLHHCNGTVLNAHAAGSNVTGACHTTSHEVPRCSPTVATPFGLQSVECMQAAHPMQPHTTMCIQPPAGYPAMPPHAAEPAVDCSQQPASAHSLLAGVALRPHSSALSIEQDQGISVISKQGVHEGAASQRMLLGTGAVDQQGAAYSCMHANQQQHAAHQQSVPADVPNTQNAADAVLHSQSGNAQGMVADLRTPGGVASWHDLEADVPMRLAVVQHIIQEVLANLPKGLRPERAEAFHGCVAKLEQALYTGAADAAAYADRKTLMPRFLALRKQLLVAAGRRSTTH